MKRCIQPLLHRLVLTNVVASLCVTSPGQAQIVSDSTTGTTATGTGSGCTVTCSITGGTSRGSNLFHSFVQFSVPSGTTAIFDYTLTPSIQNIFARVTGGFPSNVNGAITTAPAGRVSLFLLNPAGIVFGHGASLNVGGSFIGTTASSIRFADGSEFTAASSPASPLTVSVPIGLQFGGSQRNINVTDVGSQFLQVPAGNTLALVGGAVTLRNSRLLSPGGRIEIGAVAGQNQVSLTPISAGWSFGYNGVSAFQNIQITQESQIRTNPSNLITASSLPVGPIQIVGQDITLSDGSFILQRNSSNTAGGDTLINAQRSFALIGSNSLTGDDALIETNTFSQGNGSDIVITAPLVTLSNGAVIDTRTSGSGSGGNIRIVTSQLTMQNGAQIFTTISSGAGNTGSIGISANQVSIESGSQIRAETITGSTGNGGNLTIASNQVRVTGFNASDISSALLARTFGRGNSGNLSITTRQLTVDNGGQISASTGGSGQGGQLSINATGGSVQVIGASNRPRGLNSGLFSQSLESATGNAGGVTVNTDRLIVQNGGEISVSSVNGGTAAGNLVITSPFISLDQSRLRADTAGEQGNVTLQTRDLRLRQGSSISTNATGTASGGNIRISTATLVALENSDITANARRGSGGRVSIQADGIFGTAFRAFPTPKSDITATSELGPDFSGTVTIQTPAIDPSRGLLQLAPTVVDPSKLISRECSPKSNQSTGEFIVTGRGGLPPSPSDALENDGVLVDLGQSVPSGSSQSGRQATVVQSGRNIEQNSLGNSPGNSLGKPVTEVEAIAQAQGWMVNTEGKVVLLAQAPMTVPLIPWLTPPACHAR